MCRASEERMTYPEASDLQVIDNASALSETQAISSTHIQ